jgi:hypothetical protein
MATILERPATVEPTERRNTVDTRPYVVTIIRRIPYAVDANEAVHSAELGAGSLVDIEVVEDRPPR